MTDFVLDFGQTLEWEKYPRRIVNKTLRRLAANFGGNHFVKISKMIPQASICDKKSKTWFTFGIDNFHARDEYGTRYSTAIEYPTDHRDKFFCTCSR